MLTFIISEMETNYLYNNSVMMINAMIPLISINLLNNFITKLVYEFDPS